MMLICIAFLGLKLRLDVVKADLKKAEQEIEVLADINKKNVYIVNRLEEKLKKQEEIAQKYYNDAHNISVVHDLKKQEVHKISKKSVVDWKKEKIPEEVLKILQ